MIEGGYINSKYTESLVEFGSSIKMKNCAGNVLGRKIPGTSYSDAMGPYPLFLCKHWNEINKDILEFEMKGDLISLSLVTDPFGDFNPQNLMEIFTDKFYLFKDHFIIDLEIPFNSYIKRHHRRNIQISEKNLKIEFLEKPIEELQEWDDLYQKLIGRHNLKGIQAFSKRSFNDQLKIPGLFAFKAKSGNDTVGILLYYVTNNIAYAHLTAYNEIGYEKRASYGLTKYSLDYLKDIGVRWVTLGSGAGISNDSNDGLNRFKKGWATGMKPVYLCGKIFDAEKYNQLVLKNKTVNTNYFPAYRDGEFRKND